MRSDRFPRATWLVIGAVSVTVTLSVARRSPAVILGGHGTKTDCFAVFDGIDSTGGGTPKVRCTDGDPSCDRDGDCHNGSCTFHFRVCINQPNVTGCTPPAAGLKKIRTIPPKYRSFTSGLTGSQLTRATCGEPGDVMVKLRGKKKNKPGRQQIRVFAQANGAPPDSDLVNLFCLPRPANQACPPPGTTTTTLPPCPPGGACTCSGGKPSMLSFTTTAGGSGTCGHLDADGTPNFFTLACGGLYFGGANVGVPLPSKVPDFGNSILNASCSGSTLTLTGTSAAQAGGNKCTQGLSSKRGTSCTSNSDCAGPCGVDGDCTPGGICNAASCNNAKCAMMQCTNAGCLYGPPLPIPNSSNGGAATSTCVINTITANGAGTADCVAGSTTALNLPLSSAIFLDADLLAMRCSGGTTPGANCTGSGGCGTVAAGSCPGGTC